MVNPAWWAAGLAVPAVALQRVIAGRGQKREEEPLGRAGDEGGADPSFVCERVCTSVRLMRRMGGLAVDASPGTCVTVCGTSSADACTDACQQAVCAGVHQVPAWGESCISRCSTECQRGRTV